MVKKYPIVSLLLVVAVTISLLLSSTGCKRDGDQDLKNVVKNNLEVELNDSLVVDQLIQRSETFFTETGAKAELYDSFLKEAYEIAERRNLMYQQGAIYNMMGKRYRNRALYGEAMKSHQKALNIAQKINHEGLLADVYNQIGVVYRRTDDNAMALDMHFKALRMAEHVKDTFNISVSINSIGNVNLSLGRYHTAIQYFTQSLAMSDMMGNLLGKAINYNNIGDCWHKLGELDSALYYHNLSLDYNSRIGSRIGQAICFASIGTDYIAKGEPEKALEYLDKSLRTNRKLGDLMQVAFSLGKIGETYFSMNKYAKAQEYLLESYEMASTIGSKFQAEETARLLSKLNEINGNHAKALEYYKKASVYKDSMLNEKNMFHITTMEAVLDSEAQRDKITLLNQETLKQQSVLGRQRLLIVFFIVIVAVFISVTTLLVFQFRLRNKYRNLKHQQRLLRSQMNPHFIFNALSAIQVYVLENDVEKSTRFLTDFAKLMRQVLRSSNHDYISLKEESEILKYYLELQKLRFVTPFDYFIDVDKSLDWENVVVPPMITQPFVENAIEHGLKPIDRDGYLTIRFRKVGLQVIVEVEDNGIGIDTAMAKLDKPKSHDSMAIKITKERLDVIRNDSGGKVGLEIIDKKSINPFDRGTIVRIILPLVEFNSSKPRTDG
jgi:tetratricopeptide (TPR) repeat protein